MANKSYKQLYEELKAERLISKEELLALTTVAHGCNVNTRLRGQTHNGVRYEDALVTTYKLIARLAHDNG